MRVVSRSVPLLGIAVLALSGEPRWHRARAAGTGCWPPRCAAGQLPLALPLVEHGGRLFMVGDGAAPGSIYESPNGENWQRYEHDAGWGSRYGAAPISYRGSLWRAGGFSEASGRRTLMNDVWRSGDGRRWEQVLAQAPWAARTGAHLVAFRDTLWLLGGEPGDGLLWATTDGLTWLPRQSNTLPAANPQAVLVHRGALWLLGHGAWNAADNDVWSSPDAVTWTRIAAHADWSARTGAGFGALDGRLWVIGGSGRRDVWSSADGVRWRRAADLPGPPRAANYSVVFQDRLWVYGGKTGGLGGTGFWDEVWYLK